MKIEQDKLRNIELFKNKDGQLKPLSLLMDNTSKVASSGIISLFQINYPERYNGFSDYYMQRDEIWENISNSWKDIQPALGDTSNYKLALEDLNKLYDKYKSIDSILLQNDTQWVLNTEDKLVSKENCFYNEEIAKQEQGKYDLLIQLIESIAPTLNLVHLNFYKDILKVTFAEQPKATLGKLKDVLGEKEVSITKGEIEILYKCGTNFFEHFTLKKDSQDFVLVPYNNNTKQYYSDDESVNTFLENKEEFCLLPSELFPIFKGDAILLQKTDELASQLMEEYRSQEAFIDLITKCGNETKEIYLIKKAKINLNSTDASSYADTFEGKFIKLLADVIEKKEAKGMIYINNKPLRDFTYSEDITILTPYSTFKLSQLIPQFEGRTDVFKIVKNRLENIGNVLFETKAVNNKNLANTLVVEIPKLVNTEQVTFLAAYQLSKEEEKCNFSKIDISDVPKGQILQTLYEKGIDNFASSFLGDAFFTPKRYIHADDDLLLVSEKIPEWVKTWLGNDEKKKKYLYNNNGLTKANSPVVEFRKAIYNNDDASNNIAAAINSNFIDNTFEWIANKGKVIEEHKKFRYRNIKKLITAYVPEHKKLPSYLLEIDLTNDKYQFKLTNSFDKKYYLSNKRRNDEISILKEAAKKAAISFIDAESDQRANEVFLKLLENKGIKKAELISTVNFDKEKRPQEWESMKYKEWKEDYPKYTIYISEKEIPFLYEIEYGGEKRKIKTENQGQSALYKDDSDQKEIYVYKEKGSEKSVINLLAEQEKHLFKSNKDALINLVNRFSADENELELIESIKSTGIATKGFKEVIDIIKEKELSSSNIISKILEENPDNKNGKRGYDLGKELKDDEVNNLKELVQKVGGKDLAYLTKKIDEVKHLLKSLEEDDKSTPSLLIGYIGEVLALKWLKQKHGENNVNYDEIDEDSNGRIEPTYKKYDIKLILEKTYFIDVKTTIESISDKSVAFYFTKEEENYIREEKLDNYYILRLSLKDLGLNDFYKELDKGKTPIELINCHKKTIDHKIEEFLYSGGRVQLDEGKGKISFNISIPEAEIALF